MGLIDNFNQWIVERGSAVVQEKHIALFRDQLIAADKEIAALKEKITTLETENQNLKTANQNLTKEKEELRSIIQKNNNLIDNPVHAILLDATQVKILNLLFNRPRLSPESIRQTLNTDLETIRFHLIELKKQKMIKKEMGSDYPPREMWSVDQEGRRYVKNHTQNP